VVVLIIHQDCVIALEFESHSPILANPHGIVPLKIALERMKSPAGEVHIVWIARGIQSAQLSSAVDFPDNQ
jgi:hypothetical protein